MRTHGVRAGPSGGKAYGRPGAWSAGSFPMAKVLLLALAVLLAGCLAPEDVSTASLEAETAPTEAPAFGLSLTGCREGGGVSLYNMQEGDPGPVEPFQLADVQDDVGDPRIASYGSPIPPGGDTWGIWHVSALCDSYAHDGEGTGPLEWGWVGVKILPPPWDDSGIERQYFVADLSFKDETIVDDLRALDVHASKTFGVKVEWLAPMVLHTVLDDEDHGVFETHAKMKDYRALDARTTRFWMLVAEGGGHAHAGGAATDALGGDHAGYRAVSFDVVDTAGDGHFVVDGTGVLSHTRTDAHGAVPGAAGNLAGVLYTGFDRTITLGPSPDMVFDTTWTH